jgi:hypothetical protein
MWQACYVNRFHLLFVEEILLVQREARGCMKQALIRPALAGGVSIST